MSHRPEGMTLLSIPHHYIDSNRCVSQQTCNYQPGNLVFFDRDKSRSEGGKSECEG